MALGDLGEPSYETGCPGAEQDFEVKDRETVFDQGTCETKITREFRLVDDGCEDKAVSFDQKITLTNTHKPEWDFFPPDVTIAVFDDYGTDATGFPTAFQACGAAPVEITYTDEIEEGGCFAERILTRTFEAVDICGHATVQTQTIKITNNDGLPLGETSLAKVYGRDIARIGNDDTKCLWPAYECGVSGAPVLYQCESGDDEEFAGYQSYLDTLSTSLDLGTLETSCDCEDGDTTCDERVRDPNYNESVYYGVPRTVASGTCTVDSSQTPGTNAGTFTQDENPDDCPALQGSGGNGRGRGRNGNGVGNGRDICIKKTLTGTDTVYNIFEVDALEFETKSVVIDCPASSIVLVKVKGEYPDKKITFGRNVRGVELVDVEPKHVLWNVPNPTDFKLTSTVRDDWSWQGTMLNGKGVVALTVNDFSPWTGQIFCKELNANKISFECGHFSGFASCSNVMLNIFE